MQQEDFSRYNGEGTPLRKAQLRMLDILVAVDKICQKHHIEYYLEGGSLLGAIRHGGFIPWDDDLDISVMRDDYPRLRTILMEELPDNMVFQDAKTDFNYPLLFGKVRDKNSYIEESDLNKIKEQGIYIDIFPNEKVPSMWWKRKLDYPYGHCFRAIHNYTDTSDKIISYIVYPFAWILVQFTRMVNKFIPSDKIAYSYGCQMAYNNYSRNDVFPLIKVPFENIKVPVPHNYDAVLTALYGDYMQIPPEEKRRVHGTKIVLYDK